MKKVFKRLWCLSVSVATVISFVVMTSCEEEKHNGKKNEPTTEDYGDYDYYKDLIVGTWSDDGDLNWYEAPTRPNDYGWGPVGGSSYGFEFRANGTCYVHGSNYGSGKYQIINDQLIITFKDHGYEQWTDKYTIIKLTKNILELLDNDDEDDDTWHDSETYYRVK